MLFIADVMLGRLARRLRLLGYDVVYDRYSDDNEIIRISLQQKRLILTRDRSLAKRPLARQHLLIDSENPDKQVRQVIKLFPPAPDSPPLSRCSECNTLLIPVDKHSVRDIVPEHIYGTRKQFLLCPGCRRIYWEGSHVDHMGLKKRD